MRCRRELLHCSPLIIVFSRQCFQDLGPLFINLKNQCFLRKIQVFKEEINSCWSGKIALPIYYKKLPNYDFESLTIYLDTNLRLVINFSSLTDYGCLILWRIMYLGRYYFYIFF